MPRRFRMPAVAMVVALVAAMLGPHLSGASASPEWTGKDYDWDARVRLDIPEDRFAMAGGCYALYSSAGLPVIAEGDGYALGDAEAADTEAFYFRATGMGPPTQDGSPPWIGYLLFDDEARFLAASEGALADAGYGVTRSEPGAIAGGVVMEQSDAAADEAADSPANRAAGRGRDIVAADEPSDLAEWRVEEAGQEGFRFLLPETAQALGVGEEGVLEPTTPEDADTFTIRRLDEGSCESFPEIEVNVNGPVLGGQTSFQEVRGLLEGHLHMMAYEFLGGRARCGRPWHRFGPAYALVDCPDHAQGGFGAVLEGVVSNGSPDGRHNTDGWPTFEGWPKHDSLTHEQVYYKWLERAWRGGLRLFVNLLVDNGQLCQAYPYKRNSCNEMDGVRLQAKRIRELERYIDAQSGGPGEGWFRIVTDPFEARRVINEGRLAVVLGIEVSVPLDCGLTVDLPACDTGDVERGLDEVYDLGVRQMELVNKFDNAFSGVTGDSGTTGPVVNAGNFGETKQFWRMETCGDHPDDHEHAHDKRQPNPSDDIPGAKPFTSRDSIFGAVLALTGKSGAAPVYPEGPHCNVRALSDLGRTMIAEMAERGMIFDPDHMSARARTQALDFIESEIEVNGHPYSGIISSHSWADDTIYPRIYELGGVVTPHAGGSGGFVAKWEKHREWIDERFYFGFGFGSDVNGLSTQGGPRGGNAVSYPFEGFGGAQIDRQVSGTKAYDINAEGVAHYGLYPDWLEDLRRQAGQQIVEDMVRGAEAYLQMWERAIGVSPDACRADVGDLNEDDLAGLEAGMTAEDVIWTLGQPSSRTGTGFTYCTEDGPVTLEFTSDGELILTTVPDDDETGGSSPTASPTGTPEDDPSDPASVSPTPTEDASQDPQNDPGSGGGQGGGGQGGGGQGGGASATPDDDHGHAGEEPGAISTSMVASRRVLRAGRRITLSGQIDTDHACGGSFIIDIAARTHGSTAFKTVASVDSDSDLSWTTSLRPRANRSYVATAQAVGRCEGITSTPVDVRVRVKIVARLPQSCARSRIVRGRVSPRRPGTRVVMQRRVKGAWKKIDRATLDERSRFRLETDRCRGAFRILWKGPDVRNAPGALRFRLR